MIKKLIAPIVIGALIVIYYVFFFVMIMSTEITMGIKLLLGIVPLGLAGVMIAVVYARIKEITGGEEDDLSKY